jgi:hypothetical protein
MSELYLSTLPWKSKASPVFITKDEKILRASLQHIIKDIPNCIIFLLLLATCIAMFFFSANGEANRLWFSQTLFLSGLGGVVFLYHWLFYNLLSFATCDIILTNKRVLFITHRLWLSSVIHDISLSKMNAVEAETKGLWQRIFNYGDLWFDTGGSNPGEMNQTITLVPSPQAWADAIASALKAL